MNDSELADLFRQIAEKLDIGCDDDILSARVQDALDQLDTRLDQLQAQSEVSGHSLDEATRHMIRALINAESDLLNPSKNTINDCIWFTSNPHSASRLRAAAKVLDDKAREIPHVFDESAIFRNAAWYAKHTRKGLNYDTLKAAALSGRIIGTKPRHRWLYELNSVCEEYRHHKTRLMNAAEAEETGT